MILVFLSESQTQLTDACNLKTKSREKKLIDLKTHFREFCFYVKTDFREITEILEPEIKISTIFYPDF